MKAAILLSLSLYTIPASANDNRQFSCEEVRAYVAQHGKAKALAFAIRNGASWAQIRDARKCLKRSS